MLTRLLATSALVLALAAPAFAQSAAQSPGSAATSSDKSSAAGQSGTTAASPDKSGTAGQSGSSASSGEKSGAAASGTSGSTATSGDKSGAAATGSAASGTSGSTATSGDKSGAAATGSAATGTSGSTATSSDKTTASGSTAAGRPGQAAEKMKPDHLRASKLIGTDVYGPDDKKIGDVAELILDKDGKVQQVVVSVGGFLGIGDKHIALSMDELKLGQQDRLTVAMTKDQLQAHPSFEYAERESDRTRAGSSTAPAGRAPAMAPATGSTNPPASRTQ